MSEADTHPSNDDQPETDGGAVTGARQDHRETNYLTQEVNLLRPSTPFMRDHLRVVRTGFVAWVLIVFGPVTATAIAPGLMTTQLPVLGFPLHYFLVAVGGPGGALVLSAWYARKRDALDEKYDIEHEAATGEAGSGGSEGAAVTDGGEGR